MTPEKNWAAKGDIEDVGNVEGGRGQKLFKVADK